MTRDEYDTLKYHDYAGIVSQLRPATTEVFKKQHQDWDGTYWRKHDGPDGITLGPINIRHG